MVGALALCVCVFEGAHQMASASLLRVWSLHHHHQSAGTTQKPQILGKSLENLPHIPASIVRLLKSLANPFQIVKDQKTDEGLDLTSSKTILEHLAKWCERMCKEHSIDPGSEAMQALLQQAHWHEERSEVEALEPAASERERLHLNEKARQICPMPARMTRWQSTRWQWRTELYTAKSKDSKYKKKLKEPSLLNRCRNRSKYRLGCSFSTNPRT